MKLETEEAKQFSELKISDIGDPSILQRKLISRILTAANYIASHNRKGPANYININNIYLTDSYNNNVHLAGIKIYNSDAENIITVGRIEEGDTEGIEIDINLS